MSEALLDVRDVKRHYAGGRGGFRAGPVVKAVDGVSLQVRAGETMAIVGESGCGKSTLARIVAGLDEPTAGSVAIAGEALSVRGIRGRREVARRVQIVFQDPFSSLNPRMRVQDIVAEPLEAQGMPREERMACVARLFQQVGLPAETGSRLPHQFSGGQRQRIAIARALSVGPRLLVLDEPVSALDVSVRAQILNLLADLKYSEGIASVLISHDMSAVQHLADRVAVMYLGQLVEVGDAAEVFARPAHPYTRTLLSAIPRLGVQLADAGAPPTEGPASNAGNSGATACRFAPRCAHAIDICRASQPALALHPGIPRQVACHRAAQLPLFALEQESTLAPALARRLAILRNASETRHATPAATV